MRFPRILPCAVLCLAACSSASAPSITQEQASSPQSVTADQALNQSFLSPALGISFRYPAAYENTDCNEPVPLTAVERTNGVDLEAMISFNSQCNVVQGGTPKIVASIETQHAADAQDLQKFADRLSPGCTLSEQDDTGSGSLNVFFKSAASDPSPDQQNACGFSIVWLKDAGIAYQTVIGSKDAGILFPSSLPVHTDNGDDSSYDYAIRQSIQPLAAQ